MIKLDCELEIQEYWGRARASKGPGTGPGTGPGRGFRKSSGLRVSTGPGLQCICYIKSHIKRFSQAEIDRNNVMAMLVDL